MSKDKMQVVYKKTDALIPYINNARTHSDAQVSQIAASIKEFGFNNPILLDGDNGIVAGHGRCLAAKKLSIKEIPCIELSHLSDAQKKAYILADNKIAINAGWDDETLRAELEELKTLDVDFSLLGFGKDELDELLDDNGGSSDGLTDENATPEVPEEPKTKLGDIYKLGNHRLMCGDSTDKSSIERLMDGNIADMWLTDPPYNVALGFDETPEEAKKRNRRTDGLTVKNDKMDNDSFRQFLRDAYSAADAVMKRGAVFYIWHADSEGYNFRGAAADIGWPIRQCLIWKKSSLVMGRQDYHWIHEPCLYGWKDGAAHLWATDRKQTTILEFDKPSRNGEHPTMKPVALFEYQILNNTKSSHIVLDSFGGSGTTMIACEKNNRSAYLMELDPKYCDVIVKRWEDFTGKKAELVNE